MKESGLWLVVMLFALIVGALISYKLTRHYKNIDNMREPVNYQSSETPPCLTTFSFGCRLIK